MTRYWRVSNTLLLIISFCFNTLNGENTNSFQGSNHQQHAPLAPLQSSPLMASIMQMPQTATQPHSQSHLQFQPMPQHQQQQHNQTQQQQRSNITVQQRQSFASLTPQSPLQQQPYPQQLPVPLQPHQQQQQTNERVSELIATKILDFALGVGRDLSANQYYSKSEVFSPMSIASAIALLLLGSKGESYKELSALFGMTSDAELQQNPGLFHQEFGKILRDLEEENPGFILNHRKNVNWQLATNMRNIRVQKDDRPIEHIIKIANGVFTQNGFTLNPHYKDVVTSIYHSELVQLDFFNNAAAATDFINKWVALKTFGRIPTILNNPVVSDTKVILASALYFKAFWENTFFVEATNDDKFFTDGEQAPPIKVKMMATGGVFPFYDAPEYNCRIIGLPYRGNLTTMYIIQPQKSSRENLRALQASLNANVIEYMISRMTKKTAVLAMPKMHIVRTTNMKNIMQRLGIKSIFSPSASDLSLIESTEQPPQPSYYSDMSESRLAAVQRPAFSPGFYPTSKPKMSHHDIAAMYNIKDRFDGRPLIFQTRFGGANETTLSTNNSTNVAENGTKVEMAENKTETTESAEKRTKRQAPLLLPVPLINRSLESLEAQRHSTQYGKHSDLFVDDILHKVDFDVNEHGTEAAAATLTYLKRSGTDILFRADSPFLVLIRHDPTKMVLFYGIINEPES